jgi:hypothetical protein
MAKTGIALQRVLSGGLRMAVLIMICVAGTACQNQPSPLQTPVVINIAMDTPVPGKKITPSPTTEAFTIKPIDALQLKPVTIYLQDTYPDGTSRKTTVDIDSQGSYHLKEQHTVTIPAEFSAPAGIENNLDLFNVSGKIFIKNGAGKFLSGEPYYAGVLPDLLAGPDGAQMWLSLLAKQDMKDNGAETQGGFTCRKFIVNGMGISGEAWLDQVSGLLVRANLDIPSALITQPGTQTAGGNLQIDFQITKTDIQTINAPQ